MKLTYYPCTKEDDLMIRLKNPPPVMHLGDNESLESDLTRIPEISKSRSTPIKFIVFMVRISSAPGYGVEKSTRGLTIAGCSLFACIYYSFLARSKQDLNKFLPPAFVH